MVDRYVDAGGVRHVRYCVVRMGRRLRRLVRMMLPRASVAVGVFSVYKVTTYLTRVHAPFVRKS
jgi:hypothetical protein